MFIFYCSDFRKFRPFYTFERSLTVKFKMSAIQKFYYSKV